jgi:hypothetical protein
MVFEPHPPCNYGTGETQSRQKILSAEREASVK